MSSSNEPPGGQAGPGKRRPPTIDLKATEVSEPAAGAEPGAEAASTTGSRRHPAIAWLPADFPWPLVAAGAEVIIPAGGLPMLLFARERPFVIEGAPVLNGIAVVAKAAEMALALKDITKVFVSRRATYARAPQTSIDEFLATLT